MKIAAICFTKAGASLIKRWNDAAESAGISCADAYISMQDAGDMPGFTKTEEPLALWAENRASEGCTPVFVSALGIAVRARSGLVKDKLTDVPVIVMDDGGNFVIPVLSGHAGGANKLAVTIAKLTGAIPVITTATDVHGAFSVDVFAKENGLTIRNREGIKRVSAKAVEGKSITLSFKDYPPKDPVDVIIADETDREYSLLLSPKPYTVGIGSKKGVAKTDLENAVIEVLTAHDIKIEQVYAICTVDRKEEENAIVSLSRKYAIPLFGFDAPLLQKAEGDFASSPFVEQTVGVDNVCERAAVLGAGAGAELVVSKTAKDGITVADAKRKL